jgi:hypothetical protein
VSGAPATDGLSAQSGMPPAYFTLFDIFSGRDDRRVVSLQTTKTQFKVGRDLIGVTVSSTQPGFLYLLMVGSDGKTFDMLFPNKIDSQNEIRAGEPVKLPRFSWQVKAGGPAGKNHLLAIVADAPRDFSQLGMKGVGPFSIVEANPVSGQEIQRVSATPASATRAECADDAKRIRNLIVQKRCSGAYGAAMAVIEEVD